MPMKMIPWNIISSCGNPTRAPQINDMIKLVVRKELRKHGKPSQARIEFVDPEWVEFMTVIQENFDHYEAAFLSGVF